MLLRTPISHNFAAAFHTVPETEIVGVFDLGEQERTEFVSCWQDVWSDLPTYSDFDRLLGELQPDLLCIATRQPCTPIRSSGVSLPASAASCAINRW